jgi:serine/threonine-protein kinase
VNESRADIDQSQQAGLADQGERIAAQPTPGGQGEAEHAETEHADAGLAETGLAEEGLPPGHMVGEFRLLRLLGRGGMAEVYLAEQTSLHRQVALKILRSDVTDREALLRRFEREARAAAGLSHPNIVQVYVVGEQQGLHFIAQEYVQGLNLKEYIRRKAPPSATLALHFMKQIAGALQKAGAAGIVHRDIKPENILITRKGVAKVADFGLAQLAPGGDGQSVELTQIGTTMGTPLYMSPEQVQGEKLDHRSDIYSFGVTCYHMLAGRPPFRGETAVSIAVQHMNSKPEPLGPRRPDLPLALCHVVRKMMAKDPAKRYQDAGAVLKDLRQISAAMKENLDVAALSLSGFDEEVAPPAPPTLLQRLMALPLWQKAALFLVGCVLLAGAGALAAWLARPFDPLAVPPSRETSVKRQNSAAEQLELATVSFRHDEDAWQAVIDYFPSEADLPYRLQAREQLGLLYLQRGEKNRARQQFERMIQVAADQYPEIALRGEAGLALLASLEGDHAQALRIIQKVEPRANLYDGRLLGDYIGEAKRRAREALEPSTGAN